MINLLLICEDFAPNNVMGAIRPTKIAKYLALLGHYRVTVMCQKKNNVLVDKCLYCDMKYLNKVYLINQSRFVKYLHLFISKKTNKSNESEILGKKHTKKKNILKEFISKYSRYFITNIIIYYDQFRQMKEFVNSKLLKQHFDVMITFGPNSSHSIGRYLKRKKNIFWIADYRDPVYSPFIPLGFKQFSKNYAKATTGLADYVTVVSPGYLTDLFLKQSQKALVITNGYDLEDIGSTQKKRKNDSLCITCVGNLYDGRRDVSVLFKAIKENIDSGIFVREKITIHYAGRNIGTFYQQANKFQLGDIIYDYGFLPREKSIELQLNSHILILPSWDSKESHSVIPGKLFEYMMMNRPIIGLISGNRKASIVKKIIKETQVGVCYESANEKCDYIELMDYLKMQYSLFLNNEDLFFKPDPDKLKLYNYKNIASLFNDIIRSSITFP